MSQPSIGQPPAGQPSPPDDPTPATSSRNPAASLPELFWIFFQIGAMSFGGGLTAWVHREIALKRGWMTDAEFFTGLALCQVLPGVNVVNLSVHVGQRLRGVVGALTCTIGVVVVPFFAVIGLVTIYDLIKDLPWLSDFLDGVAVSAVGLLVSVALRAARSTFRGVMPFAVALALIVTVGLLHWPMIPMALTLGPLSVLSAWLTRNRAVKGRDA
jgi:chromate transporter